MRICNRGSKRALICNVGEMELRRDHVTSFLQHRVDTGPDPDLFEVPGRCGLVVLQNVKHVQIWPRLRVLLVALHGR